MKWVDKLSNTITNYIISMRENDIEDFNEMSELRNDLRHVRKELRERIFPDSKKRRKMDSWVLNDREFKLERKKKEREDHGSIL